MGKARAMGPVCALLAAAGCVGSVGTGNGTPPDDVDLTGMAGMTGGPRGTGGSGGLTGAGGTGGNVMGSLPDGGAGMTGGGGMTGTGTDGGPAAENGPIDFFRDIQPILGDFCVRCHGGVRELGPAGSPPLNLQSREKAMAGRPGIFGMILGRVAATAPADDPEAQKKLVDFRMPAGAPALPADKIDKIRRWIAEGASWPQHWAFAPLKDAQPNQVTVRDEAWVQSPVDRFVLNRLEKANIKPSPEAERPTLLRRVSLDLTGLPPTPKQVDDFVADTSATAYEKVVDRLLVSANFGERWGRHWLDQARYADSDGYEKDTARMNAWRWRDWVVDAFNKDLPFDQFTIEQIAGDLIPGATSLQKLATAFHSQTLKNNEGGVDQEEDRVKRVIDRVATVGNTWLGLSLQCTQCHSHAYDQLPQKDFYRMFAFFNNADDATAKVPMTSNLADTQVMDAALMQERTSSRRSTYLLTRGDFLNPDKAAGALTPAPLTALHPFTPRGATPDRLDLARWLVDSKNVLTPRVTVNTIWYHLFGEGIVASLDDWGIRATLPSHPELLDWLARDFVANGWKRKRVIKQIVMSATYRQSSVFRTSESGNALLYRQNRVRVEAEIVTDQALAASGLLTNKVGGPTVFPPVQDEMRELIKGAYSNFVWADSQGPDRYRRGLYTFHKRTALYPNLQVFDRPMGDVSVNGRGRSNTPLQALATMHNTVFDESAQALARRVQTDKPGDLRQQLIWAMRLAVARTPSDAEIAELQGIFQDAKTAYDADQTSASKAVAVFAPTGVPASDAAAWVATARAVLNLDEFITRE